MAVIVVKEDEEGAKSFQKLCKNENTLCYGKVTAAVEATRWWTKHNTPSPPPPPGQQQSSSSSTGPAAAKPGTMCNVDEQAYVGKCVHHAD